MNRIKLAILGILVAFCSALGGPKPFERVETFPAGEQQSAGKSIIGGRENTVAVILSAPYSAVWPAVKSVAQKFDKVGNRPIVGIDEHSGRVQNGRISSDALIGRGEGLGGAWADEFVMEATQATSATTRLSVTRKLVHKGGLGGTGTGWEARSSNGRIERWLITEVMKELETPATPRPSEITRSADATTYIYKGNDKAYIDLNGDGSFLMCLPGKQYRGQYTIAGEELTLTIGTKAIKRRLVGNSMFDTAGQEWVKAGGGSIAPAATQEPGKSSGDTSFTNTDIVALIKARLPDSVIISKIKSSSCNFDTSTIGLVKLKDAGAGDSVIQAVMDCKR